MKAKSEIGWTYKGEDNSAFFQPILRNGRSSLKLQKVLFSFSDVNSVCLLCPS